MVNDNDRSSRKIKSMEGAAEHVFPMEIDLLTKLTDRWRLKSMKMLIVLIFLC